MKPKNSPTISEQYAQAGMLKPQPLDGILTEAGWPDPTDPKTFEGPHPTPPPKGLSRLVHNASFANRRRRG